VNCREINAEQLSVMTRATQMRCCASQSTAVSGTSWQLRFAHLAEHRHTTAA
jgi:hypothetical protein